MTLISITKVNMEQGYYYLLQGMLLGKTVWGYGKTRSEAIDEAFKLYEQK